MINILFDSVARAGGIESGHDVRIQEVQQRRLKTDASPTEVPDENKVQAVANRRFEWFLPGRPFFQLVNNRFLI